MLRNGAGLDGQLDIERSKLLLVAALIAVAVGAAALVTLVPDIAKVGFVLLMVAPVVIIAARRALKWQGPAESAQSEPTGAEAPAIPVLNVALRQRSADGDFKAARFFYYLGLLLIGQLAFRPALDFTLSDWFFLLALGLTCFQMLAARSSGGVKLPGLLVLGIGLFSLGGMLSTFGAEDQIESFVVLVKFAYLSLVWFWLGTVLLRTRQHIMIGVALWAISAAINGAATLVQFFVGNVIPYTTVDGTRLAGFTDHVNDLGGLAGIVFVPAIMFATRKTQSLPSTLLSYAPLALATAGLVLSSSNSGFMAAAVGFAIWVILGRVQFRLLLLLVVAAVVGVLLMEAQVDAGARSPIERFTTSINADNDEEATFWSRVLTFDAAWEEIRDNPIIGVGLDSTSQVTRTGYQVHNVILGAWFEAGALGAVGIFLTIISAIVTGVSTVRHARSREEWLLALALLASVLAFMVFAMSAPVLYKRIVWVGVALMLALRAQQLRDEQQSDVAAEAATPQLRLVEPRMNTLTRSRG